MALVVSKLVRTKPCMPNTVLPSPRPSSKERARQFRSGVPDCVSEVFGRASVEAGMLIASVARRFLVRQDPVAPQGVADNLVGPVKHSVRHLNHLRVPGGRQSLSVVSVVVPGERTRQWFASRKQVRVCALGCISRCQLEQAEKFL